MAWPKKELKYSITYEQIYDLYIIQNLSQTQCAEILNVSNTVISKRLKMYNIQKDSKLILELKNQHRKETLLKKYGRTNVGQFGSPEHNAAMLKKYGTINVLTVPEIQEKRKQASLENYGTEYYVQTDEFKEKAKQTNVKKYGVTWPIQNKLVKDKMTETCLERFGTENAMQNLDIIKLARKKYTYEDITFDSSWELALWIYAKDHNEQIIRTPTKFLYMVDNKVHVYFPDFLYNNQLIEIKGDHFFDSENNLIDKFDNQGQTIVTAKYECAKQNGVIFWTYKDIKFAISYIKAKYGKDHLKSFKN